MKTTTAIDYDIITFQVADTAALVLQAQRLCHDVYLRMRYIDQPYPNRIIPPGFDPLTTYIVAVSSSGEVVGTVRVSPYKAHKMLAEWEGVLFAAQRKLVADAGSNTTFSIGALAVNKDCSMLKISWGLYNMVYKWATAHNMDYGIITMDHRALRSLEMVGWRVIRLGDPVDYFGSPTIPAIIPVKDQAINMEVKSLPFFKYLAA